MKVCLAFHLDCLLLWKGISLSGDFARGAKPQNPSRGSWGKKIGKDHYRAEGEPSMGARGEDSMQCCDQRGYLCSQDVLLQRCMRPGLS